MNFGILPISFLKKFTNIYSQLKKYVIEYKSINGYL